MRMKTMTDDKETKSSPFSLKIVSDDLQSLKNLIDSDLSLEKMKELIKEMLGDKKEPETPKENDSA